MQDQCIFNKNVDEKKENINQRMLFDLTSSFPNKNQEKSMKDEKND